jgi:DNA-binding NarL/FixJ family response regulator
MLVLVPTRPTAGLTTRQLELLGLLIAGRTDKQIAREASIATSSVKNHLIAIRKAMGARNRQHLAYLALQRRLILLRDQTSAAGASQECPTCGK